MGFQNSEEIEKQKREIISYIKNLIVEQDLKEHDHLPSENQLSELFHANRNTVRGALTALKAQGTIYSQKGRGFFVAEHPKPLVYRHDNSLGFSEILNQGTRNYTSKVLAVFRSHATSQEASYLHLNEGEKVYHLKQLRTFNGRNLAVCDSVIPARLVPDFETHVENFQGTNHIFLNSYHFPHPTCRYVHLEASLPTEKEMALLEIPENTPILQQENIFYIEDLGDIEYFTVRARGDMFHFSMDFQ